MKLVLLVLLLAISLSPTVPAQSTHLSCASYKFSNGKQFSSCNDLPYFNASLHWNYHSSSPNDTVLVDIAYRRSALTERRWVAWAINPKSLHMVGSQALVAFMTTNGSVHAYTSPVRSYGTRLEPGNLSFPVLDMSAMYKDNGMIIFATLRLPRDGSNSTSHVVNHLWQEGPLNGDTPGVHTLSPTSPSLKAFGTVDFLSGKAIAAANRGGTRTSVKYAHAVLNTVSWGLLMPIGAVAARYCKSLGPLWFYLHLGCQLGAFVMGMAGLFSGVYMGVKYGVLPSARVHMGIGIALSCLALAQVLVGLFARPTIGSPRRKYFNWFHYLTGYSTILLSIGNVIQGFRILEAGSTWMYVYIGAIVAIGIIAAALELCRRCCFGVSRIQDPSNPDNVTKSTDITSPVDQV